MCIRDRNYGGGQIDRAALQRVVQGASSQIRFDEFCGIFQLLFGSRQAEQQLLMDVWGSVFDDQNRGSVPWPSLALKLAAACGHGPADTLELAFHLFDLNGDNRMSREEFREMLSAVIPQEAHSYLARAQEAAFESADSNRDQVLSLSEFSTLFLQPMSLPQQQRCSESSAAQVASEMEQFLERYKRSFDAAMAGIQQRWEQHSSQRTSVDRRQPVSSLPTGKHSFRFAIDLYSIQMSSMRTGCIYLCYKYPFFGATTPVRTNPPVDTVSSVETILPSEQFCAFEFTMDATTLYNELASSPLAVEVWNRDRFRSDALVGVARVRLDDIFVQPSQHGPSGSTIQVLDQQYVVVNTDTGSQRRSGNVRIMLSLERMPALNQSCLLYTSDAADEEDSVDLGGRRIIKKKNIG
eukprot:TRINITY_DN22124_c0_g1_i1.p1 TRINITY_DN22124_c0_g1~~TRINITY_DN22124_c0_g1_i1.p1  ORF type:complete len:409 (+),score=110.02 TRINITY_DN22124_c0_g1_i1:53-1279(+)